MEQDQQQLMAQSKVISAKVGQWKARGLSESDTKRTLIEPVLAMLGWDIGDPDEVKAEHSTAAGRVDYALRIQGKSEMFVEAKSLGAGLSQRDAAQLVGYCATEGVRWGLLTDGASYELYDNSNTGTLAHKLLFSLLMNRLPDDTDTSGWERFVSRFSLLQKESVSGGKIAERAPELKVAEEKEKEREKGRHVGSIPLDVLQGEEELWALVKSSFRHVEPLYRLLRAKISERMPHLRAELSSGGEGWIKFRNTSPRLEARRQYSHFLLTLKKKEVRIEIWFNDNGVAPVKETVEAKGLESAMDRKSAKGFYITKENQIDDDLISWLEAAA